MTKQGMEEGTATLSSQVGQVAIRERSVMGGPGRRSAGGLRHRAGKIKYGCLAWLIGLPLPIVILLLFYKGCDF